MIITFFKKYFLQKQFIRFVVSGSIGAGVGFLILYWLTDVFRVWYIYSSLFSFTATFIVVFTLQKFWTFEHNDLKAISWQAPLSLGVALINLLLNTLILFFLVNFLRLHYLIAQFFCYSFFAAVDFLIYNFIIFKK